jgi:AraC-like DNA-binding protein
MLSHMHEDLSVQTLAAKACLCPRQFTRRFKIEFGTTPADFVERLRLDEARRRLSNGDNRVKNVGISVGFRSADAFRRAFERRLGVNPSDYRRRFATSSSLSVVVDRSPRSIGFWESCLISLFPCPPHFARGTPVTRARIPWSMPEASL